MPDLSEKGKGQLVKSGKLTTAAGAALAIIIMQFVAFGLLMDIVSSVILVSIGFLAGRWTR